MNTNSPVLALANPAVMAPRMSPRRFAARPWAAVPLLVALAALAGCINITINFPSAEVEQAADRIIDQVYALEKLPRVRELTRLLTIAPRRKTARTAKK